MSIPWLNDDYPELFPPVESALDDPNGLLAVGGSLSTERLIAAYSQGIFPWYEENDKEDLEELGPSPILWWCPAPRCVLKLNQLKVSKSLSKSIRNRGYQVSCNNDFLKTMQSCAEARAYAEGTWINQNMIDAYQSLHQQGKAHSIECWLDNELVGGLYGIAIGKMFFGESMFSKSTDTSKIALCYLRSILLEQDSTMIDCQISNPHLLSLGAEDISLEQFQTELKLQTNKTALQFPTKKIEAKLINFECK